MRGHATSMEETYIQNFGRKNCEGKTRLEYPCADEGVEWIQLDHDRVQWQALDNTAMNLRGLSRTGK
jgi:hypothetical protein